MPLAAFFFFCLIQLNIPNLSFYLFVYFLNNTISYDYCIYFKTDGTRHLILCLNVHPNNHYESEYDLFLTSKTSLISLPSLLSKYILFFAIQLQLCQSLCFYLHCILWLLHSLKKSTRNVYTVEKIQVKFTHNLREAILCYCKLTICVVSECTGHIDTCIVHTVVDEKVNLRMK